jgi:hypothetical protein
MTRACVYAIYRPGFPETCFGELLGRVVTHSQHDAERVGRALFGGEVVACWHGSPARAISRPHPPTAAHGGRPR